MNDQAGIDMAADVRRDQRWVQVVKRPQRARRRSRGLAVLAVARLVDEKLVGSFWSTLAATAQGQTAGPSAC
ncbi:hypothetical protein [Nannocystis pusilla]|uniref:hypothetical protein n=1 Tax=Nannocystis pusilla TaxID=889268 RepID=UPI003DA525B6